MAIAMGLSLGASYIGAAFWETRTGSGDLLFGELMVWGFVHRLRNERRLASAQELLGSMNHAQRRVTGGLTAESQAKALEQLGRALEATDPHTHGHSRRVARHSWMIARQMGLRSEAVARIRTAAALHDVGKIETPTSVLRKRGPLTDDEFDVIKRHPVDGARMVAVLSDEELTSIVRHHHERLDGTGYPSGLSGEEIPLGARIIAVADTFDAITSARPYRPAGSHKKAIDILKYEAGTQLDPSVVRAFCGLYSGRRPLALWASVTSLPAQVFSWLGSGAAGVATAAQVAAVAAVAAVGTATAAAPATKPVPKQIVAARAAEASRHVQARLVAPARGPVLAGRQPGPGRGHRTHARTVVHRSSVAGGSHATHTGAPSSGAGVSLPPSGSGSTDSGSGRPPGSSEGGAGPEVPKGGAGPEVPKGGAGPEVPKGGAGPEVPKGGGKPEEPKGGAGTEVPKGGGKPEAPKGGGKPEEPKGGGKPEAPKGGGKPEEPKGGGKPEEPKGKG